MNCRKLQNEKNEMEEARRNLKHSKIVRDYSSKLLGGINTDYGINLLPKITGKIELAKKLWGYCIKLTKLFWGLKKEQKHISFPFLWSYLETRTSKRSTKFSK